MSAEPHALAPCDVWRRAHTRRTASPLFMAHICLGGRERRLWGNRNVASEEIRKISSAEPGDVPPHGLL